MQRRNKPEVLAPAGNLRGLKTAVDYGADAVYCGGKAFGMRSAPKNLSLEDFEEGARYAHERGARVYVTFNVLPRNNEVEAMREYLGKLKDTGVDALIVSDIGVMLMAKQVAPNLELHVSTQAGVTNYQAANAFYELGARRVVLAREMDLQAVRDIRARIPDDLDIECFVHGAMCMAFSGRCLFSNYLTGRDGNHGECAQPCRWDYYLIERTRPDQVFTIEQDQKSTYVFNSRDMCMIEHIPQLIECGISSLKIEGRAKSAYYVACVTNAYRHGIDAVMNGEPLPQWVVDETEKISHRAYSTGFYSGHEPGQTVNSGGYIRGWDVAAVCTGEENGMMRLSQRNRFFRGETVSVLEPGEVPYDLTLSEIYNEDMEPIESAPHATMTVYLKTDRKIKEGAFLRVKRS